MVGGGQRNSIDERMGRLSTEKTRQRSVSPVYLGEAYPIPAMIMASDPRRTSVMYRVEDVDNGEPAIITKNQPKGLRIPWSGSGISRYLEWRTKVKLILVERMVDRPTEAEAEALEYLGIIKGPWHRAKLFDEVIADIDDRRLAIISRDLGLRMGA